MDIGENIRNARKKKGMTQEMLAEKMGVSRQAVSKWESGKGMPETEKLAELSVLLGVSADRLIGIRPQEEQSEKGCAVDSRIHICSHDGSITAVLSVRYSKIAAPAKNEPPYILVGVDRTGIFGEHTVILGWYESEDEAAKELECIERAIDDGERIYKLSYFTEVEFKGILGTASRKARKS